MNATADESELQTMRKLHDDRVSRIEELKREKEAMMLELEKKPKENPHKIKELEELSEKYSRTRDEFFQTLAQKSHD